MEGVHCNKLVREMQSLIKSMQTWTANAINITLIPDNIVDAQHVIEYLKCTATQQLFTTHGASKHPSKGHLSLVCTVLGISNMSLDC